MTIPADPQRSRFDQTALRRWRRDVLRELSKAGFQNPAAMGAGLIMVSAAHFGTDVSILVELTGHDDRFVRKVLKRLRAERIITGQKVRIRWNDEGHDGFAGFVAFCCDALVAAGECYRPVDPKRSAAQKVAAQKRDMTKPRRRVKVPEGAMFSPRQIKANPFYDLEERRKPR